MTDHTTAVQANTEERRRLTCGAQMPSMLNPTKHVHVCREPLGPVTATDWRIHPERHVCAVCRRTFTFGQDETMDVERPRSTNRVGPRWDPVFAPEGVDVVATLTALSERLSDVETRLGPITPPRGSEPAESLSAGLRPAAPPVDQARMNIDAGYAATPSCTTEHHHVYEAGYLAGWAAAHGAPVRRHRDPLDRVDVVHATHALSLALASLNTPAVVAFSPGVGFAIDHIRDALASLGGGE